MNKCMIWLLSFTLCAGTITPYTFMSQTTTYLQDTNEVEPTSVSRCVHGSPFGSLPTINLCCTPHDAVFDSVITGNLVVTGSAIINNLIVTGTTFLSTLVTDTLCVNGDSLIGGYLTVQNTIDAGYYANDNEAMRVDSHREITNDFDAEFITTPTDVVLGDGFGSAVAIDGTGSFAVVGAPFQGAFNSGAAYFYVRTNDTWTLVQKEIATSIGQNFGIAVAIALHGTRIAVNSNGIAKIFTKQGASWVQEALLNSGSAVGFGNTVSFSGDGSRLLAGAPRIDAGLVLSYKRIQSLCSATPTQWILDQVILSPDVTPGSFFGSAVSYAQDGMTAIIGASGSNAGAGSVYVYERSTQNGLLVQASPQIVPLAPIAGDQFGFSTSSAANGDYFIVGAPNDGVTSSGNAYIYVRANQEWLEQKILTGAAEALLFGRSVSISADGSLALVTNANSTITGLGAVTLFARTYTDWVQMQEIVSPFTSSDRFGFSGDLAKDQSVLLIGSVGNGTSDAAVFYSANCSVVPSCLRVLGDLTVSGTTTLDNDVIISGTIIGDVSITGTLFVDTVIATDVIVDNLVVTGTASLNDVIVSGSILGDVSITGTVFADTIIANDVIVENFSVTGTISLGDVVISGSIMGNLSVTGTVFADSVVVTGPSTLVVEGDSYFNDQIKAVAGSVGAPTYTFSGALTSGLYAPAAGQLALATASTDRFTIDSTGSVQHQSSYRLDAVASPPQVLATPSGTVIKPNLVTTGSDPLSAYNPATGIYTVPATAPAVGWYLVSASLTSIPSAPATTNLVDMIFLTNGVNVTGGAQSTVADGSRVPLSYTRLMRLVPADQLSVSVSWSGGGTLTTQEALVIQLLSF